MQLMKYKVTLNKSKKNLKKLEENSNRKMNLRGKIIILRMIYQYLNIVHSPLNSRVVTKYNLLLKNSTF